MNELGKGKSVMNSSQSGYGCGVNEGSRKKWSEYTA